MSDGEIVKLDQRTGQPGRPAQVKVLGGQKLGTPSPTPETLGAAPAHGKTEIVDRHTPRPELDAPVEVVQHGEDVADSNAIRQDVIQEGDPQIRVRVSDPEARRAWKNVKEGRDT